MAWLNTSNARPAEWLTRRRHCAGNAGQYASTEKPESIMEELLGLSFLRFSAKSYIFHTAGARRFKMKNQIRAGPKLEWAANAAKVRLSPVFRRPRLR
jgi:hypothetical protein